MESTKLVEPASVSSYAPSSSLKLTLRSLSLTHFRNYPSVRLELPAGPVVLTGRNGAGKTNILEAVSLLTPGRGLRRAKLAEIDTYAAGQSWAVAATVHGMQGECKIGTGRDAETASDQADKRLVRIDGKPARSQAELGRHLAMVWLTPQMEQLFNQGASDGRKFLDRLVFSFDPEHASRINEYEYAMRNRNRLLHDGQSDDVWLAALEQSMAETAAAIAQARLSAVESLNHAISTSPLHFPKAHIAIAGAVEEQLLAGKVAVEVEDDFRQSLARARRQDAAAGRTLSGPHRSEMRVTHVENQMPAEACSTGEQKAMLLSMVLAQARSGALWKQVVPILLLDEVSAHLDATRKLELFQEICQIGGQVWMTGTDPRFFADLKGKAAFFQVDNGTVF